MSTKRSELYGKNFHFYYDYKDYKYHLEINNKEINIPNDFRDTLYALASLLETERAKVGILTEIKELEDGK